MGRHLRVPTYQPAMPSPFTMYSLLAAFLLLLPACFKYQPPPPAEPRDATRVNASMGLDHTALARDPERNTIPLTSATVGQVERPLVATAHLTPLPGSSQTAV
jgi:hypothetical protein